LRPGVVKSAGLDMVQVSYRDFQYGDSGS